MPDNAFLPPFPRTLRPLRGLRAKLSVRRPRPPHHLWGERSRQDDLAGGGVRPPFRIPPRSEEHTSELQSLMRISYAVFCLKKKKTQYSRSNKIYMTRKPAHNIIHLCN